MNLERERFGLRMPRDFSQHAEGFIAYGMSKPCPANMRGYHEARESTLSSLTGSDATP